MATESSTYPTPEIVGRDTWQGRLDQLLVREKAHTREGDAIAAARRRLPMVEVDAQAQVVGAAGSVSLLDVFEGRTQLLTYFHMWHDGKPAPEQCEARQNGIRLSHGCVFGERGIFDDQSGSRKRLDR